MQGRDCKISHIYIHIYCGDVLSLALPILKSHLSRVEERDCKIVEGRDCVDVLSLALPLLESRPSRVEGRDCKIVDGRDIVEEVQLCGRL